MERREWGERFTHGSQDPRANPETRGSIVKEGDRVAQLVLERVSSPSQLDSRVGLKGDFVLTVLRYIRLRSSWWRSWKKASGAREGLEVRARYSGAVLEGGGWISALLAN